jgi:hypothetical protein
LNARQRLHETFRFGAPDRVPYWEIIGHWQEAVDRWQEEGLPPDVHLREYFNLDRRELVPLHIGLLPTFKAEILEQDEHTEVHRDEFGILYRRVRKTGRTTSAASKTATIPWACTAGASSAGSATGWASTAFLSPSTTTRRGCRR